MFFFVNGLQHGLLGYEVNLLEYVVCQLASDIQWLKRGEVLHADGSAGANLHFGTLAGTFGVRFGWLLMLEGLQEWRGGVDGQNVVARVDNAQLFQRFNVFSMKNYKCLNVLNLMLCPEIFYFYENNLRLKIFMIYIKF